MKILLVFLAISANIIAQVQINEVCPDNDELLSSKDGKYYDWIELYNHSNESINLTEYSLSDDKDDLNAWNFGNVIIEAKSYLIIYASGIDEPTSQGELHTNFKLSSEGETLYLAKSGVMVDSIKFGNVYEDYTYGRLEENSDIKCHLATPTPSSSNKNSGTILASRESGFYVSEFDLKLTAAEGLSIYYTTNGDDPTINSKKYNGKIEIKDEYEEYEYLNVPTTQADEFNCHVKFRTVESKIPRCKVIIYSTFDEKGKFGKPNTLTFFFQNPHKIPIVSIVTDNKNLFDERDGIYVPGESFDSLRPCLTGNYWNRGEDWERDASFTYFKDEKLIAQYYNGIRIHGSGSRNAPQKSLRLYARKIYGANKFKNNFLTEIELKEFDNFIIRATMNDFGHSLIKDAVTMEAVRNLNFEQTYVQPVVLYLNGNYWGIHEIRNRFDEDYLASKYDLEEDSIEIVAPVVFGNPFEEKYKKMKIIYDYIVENDLSQKQHYEFIESVFDIPQIIDYYIAQTYFANTDWPGNNLLFWKSNKDIKYRPLFFDLDGGWKNYEKDMIEYSTQLETDNYPNPSSTNIILAKLLSNNQFKQQFVNRALYLIDNVFTFKKLEKIIDKYADTYELELGRNIDRWHYPDNIDIWKQTIFWDFYEFARLRGCFYKQHLVENFNLDADFLCNPLSVEDDSSIQLSLLPNPAESYITINNINSEFVELYSFSGVLLLRIDTKYKTDTNIDISKYPSGVYFIKTQNTMSKFIKIK